MRILLLLTVFLVVTGCGTLRTQSEAHEREDLVLCLHLCGTIPNVYGGTVESLKRLLFPFLCDEVGGESELGFLVVWPFLVPFLAADMPLSAAADTIILPYTIYRQATVGNVFPVRRREPKGGGR